MKVISIPAIIILWILAAAPAIGVEVSPWKVERGRIQRVSAGLLAHDVDGLWSDSSKEDGIDLNIEVVFNYPNHPLPIGTLLSNLGVSINDRGGTSKLYAGLLWELVAARRIFLDLGIGIAVHNGKTKSDEKTEKALGSRILFRIPVELGYALSDIHRISIIFDHVSNAYLAEPNQGLDTLGLRFSRLF